MKVVFIMRSAIAASSVRCTATSSGTLQAQYIGFTGTPILRTNKGADGRTTADVFNAGLLPTVKKGFLPPSVRDQGYDC